VPRRRAGRVMDDRQRAAERTVGVDKHMSPMTSPAAPWDGPWTSVYPPVYGLYWVPCGRAFRTAIRSVSSTLPGHQLRGGGARVRRVSCKQRLGIAFLNALKIAFSMHSSPASLAGPLFRSSSDKSSPTMSRRKVYFSARMSNAARRKGDSDVVDTIRDAILTCARKPTRVRLIYTTRT